MRRLYLFIFVLVLLVQNTLAQSLLTQAEYFFDIDPGVGNGTPVPAFTSSANIDISFSASSAGLARGMHILGIRTKDITNTWSIPSYLPFYVDPDKTVNKIEYFIDTDPGIGSATQIAISPELVSVDNDFVVSTSSVSAGPHTLGMRVGRIDENWSFTQTSSFSMCSYAAASFTTSSSCAASATSFTDTSTGTLPGDLYKWDFNNDGAIDATTVGSTSFTYSSPGTYSASLTIDRSGCENVATTSITISAVPAAPSVTTGSGCLPSASVTLSASGGSAGQYRWYTTASGGSPIAGQTNSTFITPLISTTTTFYVSISNGTCEGIRSPVIATIQTCANPPVIAAQPQVTQTEQKIVVNVTSWLSDSDDNLNLASLRIITQPSSGATASLATNGDLTIDYAGVLFAGPDVLRIEVCDLTGLCSQEDITIEVAGDIIVYNALSPNGDDKNPTLLLKYIDILSSTKTNTVSIYNRWGDEVFSVSDYDNKTRVFEGLTADGNKLPVGIYFYKISLPDAGKTVTGFISLKY